MKKTRETSFWHRVRFGAAVWAGVHWVGVASACADPSLGMPIGEETALPISQRLARDSSPFRGTENSPWTRPAVGLSLTVGAVVAGLVLVRRFMPGLAGVTAHSPIQILSHAPLGGRGVVFVVRCGPRVLIVGSTAQQLTTLAEIADPDEIEQFLPRATRSPTMDRSRPSETVGSSATELKGQLDGILDKFGSWHATG